MNHLLRRARLLGLPLFLVAIMVGAPERAQAQPYTTTSDFEIAWSLDPRAHPEHFTRGPGFGARGVLAGMDLDRDGKKEILITTDETLAPQGPDPGYLDVFLYENTGDNQYEYVWHYTHTDPSNSLPPVTWGDIDADGLYEIYMGIPTLNDPYDLFIFEQNADGTFPAEPTAMYAYRDDASLDFRPAAFALGDVDGDGQIELVTTSRTSGRREVVVISPVGQLDAFAVFNIEFEAGEALLGGGAIYDVHIRDYDGDNQNEIWVNTWDKLSMTIFEATGPDTYVLQADINQADPNVDHGSFESILFHDFDGNGKLEMLWPTTSGYLVYLGESGDVSTLTGADFSKFARFTTSHNRGADLGDLDGDDLVDVVIGTGTEEHLLWLEYNGTGSPADSSSYTWKRILEPTAAADGRFYPVRIADDLDGDGRNEIVVSNLRATEPEHPLVMVVEMAESGVAREDEVGLPAGFALEPNYPNPFNPSTRVAFDVPATSPVRLAVYDVTGRQVRVLVDGTVAAGRHEVTFDAAGLPSGVYLIRMETPQGAFTRNAVLMK